MSITLQALAQAATPQALASKCPQLSAALHVSPVQGSPSSHEMPQPPQLATEVTSVSQPFRGFWSQSENPAVHPAISHEPPTHAGRAFGSWQEASLPASSTPPSQSLSRPSQTSTGVGAQDDAIW